MTTNIPIRLSHPLRQPRVMLNHLLSNLSHALHYHILNPYKRITTFIPKAIEWVKVLWGAQTAIEAFGGGEDLVEGWICLYEDESFDTPSLLVALNHLEPGILSEWLDEYEPGLNGSHAHPELVDEFVETYGSFIRRSTQPQKQRISSETGPEGREP